MRSEAEWRQNEGREMNDRATERLEGEKTRAKTWSWREAEREREREREKDGGVEDGELHSAE